MNIRKISKNLGVRHNVSFRVIDEITGEVISTHIGHNSATNSLLTGIGHYLKGDGVLDQGWHMLSHYIPKYISLGTMGLLNQDEDSTGLPAGIGVVDYQGKVYGRISDDNLAAIGLILPGGDRTKYPNKLLTEVDPMEVISAEHATALRYIDYLNQAPGFGADGYGSNVNNNREYTGLGPMYAERQLSIASPESTYRLIGDVNEDGHVDGADLLLLIDYLSGNVSLTDRQKKCANITGNSSLDGSITIHDVQKLADFLKLCERSKLTQAQIDAAAERQFGKFTWTTEFFPTINCELISESFPRAAIGYRDLIPETEAEFPKTIDVVFSAMISTGALAQFREPGRDYIFITEAGLWSEKTYTPEGEGDNGLLAGYRIAPPSKDHWDMQNTANQKRLQQEILKVGKNQVVQVIWKIQLGSIDQFDGIESLYPSAETLKWIEHGSLLADIMKVRMLPANEAGRWISDPDEEAWKGTYDLSPANGVDLMYEGSASLVYELSEPYDITKLVVMLGASEDRYSCMELVVSGSKDDVIYNEYATHDLVDKLTEEVNLFTLEQLGFTPGSQTGEHNPKSKDIKYIKLTFNTKPGYTGTICLQDVQVSALDSEKDAELHTSLQWREYE